MLKKIEKLTKEIRKAPTTELYHARGYAYYLIDMCEEAIKDFEAGLNLDERNADCYYMHIVILGELNRHDEALAKCDESIKEDPEYAPAYLGKADIFIKQKDFNQACIECETVLKLEHNWAELHNLYGLLYHESNLFAKAIQRYSKAIELNPNDVIYYNNCGLAYKDQGLYDKAIEMYSEAVVLEPDYANSFFNRGNAFYELNFHNDALSDYSKAQQLFGKNVARYVEIVDKRIEKSKMFLEAGEVQAEDQDETWRVIRETLSFRNDVNKNRNRRKEFHSHRQPINSVGNLEFTVLRKWNSYTPIIGKGVRMSKGGGYFIKSKDKGIVVDPGFNFIDNFMAEGHLFKEIDAILITHAHNDHTADLESLLTILYKYNDDLFGSEDDEEEGSIYFGVLKTFNYSKEVLRLDPKRKAEVVNEVNKRFKKERKTLTFYVTTSVFKKYASFFNLYKISNYEVVCVDADRSNIFAIGDVKIHVIKAKHDDLFSEATSVGYCFERESDKFALIYTGDTGFWGLREEYEQLKQKLVNKNVVLVANIGGFKPSEEGYTKSNDVEKHYYKNHLGRIGVSKIVDILEPNICVISEFGEEFNGYRVKLAKVFSDVYKNKLPNTVFLPADVGLCINSEMKIRAIVSESPNKDVGKTPNTDSYGFSLAFIEPSEVCAEELSRNSETYYYSNSLNTTDLKVNRIDEFHERLR
jgi:lipoprotein NlpI